MKKNVIILSALLISTLTFSQVGINTTDPESTFDVVAKNSTGNSTNVDGLLVPRVDRQRAQSMVGVPTSTMIYVNDITTGTATGTALNIDAVGYYYFNGTEWVKTDKGNIYNSNGTLTASRTVTMEGKHMTFRGTTGVFTVDTNNNGLTRTNFLNSNTEENSRKDIRIGAGAGSIYFGVDNGSAIFGAGAKGYVDNRSGGPLIIGRNGGEQMRIMENGTIGIGTTPTSTLDIMAKNATGTSTNVDGLLIPRVDRQRAQSMIDVPTSTLIYVNDVTIGTATGTAANIDVAGYYHFDGTAWNKLNSVLADTNIYNTNGTLTGDRTVTQGANSLAFTGTTTNAFSVDGNTLSVDAANDRIGVGTVNPLAKLDIVGTTFGIKNSQNSGSWDNLWFNVGQRFPSINASGAEDGLQFNVGSNAKGTYGDDGQVLTTVATMLPSGNVGIGTTTPAARAVLELSSTDKGFLPPRLTTAQRDAIPAASRPAGLMIYNTNTNCMDFWNSAAWVSTCAGTAPTPGTITGITCGSATNNGNLTSGVTASGVTSVIPYTGGNGGSHGGQTVTSTGVTGLTATLSAGSFANGSGNLTYTITGTPSAAGTASFAINIGGRTCTLTRSVSGSAGSIGGNINCGGATNNGTLTARIAASGVSSVIPYTGGNGGSHNGQTVTSTGVTGLTATLSAGNFANGNGTLTYTITGTPNTGGTANFVINIGGKTCTLSVNVAYNTSPPPTIVCTSVGYHVNPTDPNWFHYCLQNNGKWLQYVLRCADGQVFSPAQQKCVQK